MDNIKGAIVGTIITVVIGGSAYAVNQADVVSNFAENTGVTEQQAERYVNSVTEEDLSSFAEVGDEFISDANQLLDLAEDIDCINYTYEWESAALTCYQGKSQLNQLANSEMALGRSYRRLDDEGADESDIRSTILLIDRLNANYGLPVVSVFLETYEVREMVNTNAYNKSLLQAVLQSL